MVVGDGIGGGEGYVFKKEHQILLRKEVKSSHRFVVRLFRWLR